MSDDFIRGPQCEELDPTEVGQFLVEMYKDFEELYSIEENSNLKKKLGSGNEDTSFDYDFYGDGEYEKPINQNSI